MTVQLYTNLTVYDADEYSSSPGAASAALKTAADGSITLDHIHVSNNLACGSLTVNSYNLTVPATGTAVLTGRTITAGNGLTGGGDLSADRTLAVGAGNGITVNADDVALTTPGTCSAASTNAAAGSHTHEITDTTAGAASTLVATDASGNLGYSGALVANKNATTYSGYAFVPLAAPLTSTSWDGDAYSTTAKTSIDLSAVFGAPAGIKGIVVRVAVRDSASAATTPLWFCLSPNDTAGNGIFWRPSGYPNDYYNDTGTSVVPCDANGDVYYQVLASGAGTMDVHLQIWGYFI